MIYRIEIQSKEGFSDTRGQGLVKDIRDLGIDTVEDAQLIDIYWIDTEATDKQIDYLCKTLLADPVLHNYDFYSSLNRKSPHKPNSHTVEVAYNPGVMDPVEETVIKAAIDLNLTSISAVRTAKRYIMRGNITSKQLKVICNRLLVNPIIQHVVTGTFEGLPRNPIYEFQFHQIELLRLNDSELEQISHNFGLNKEEAIAIRQYFRSEDRNPSDIELETIAQTWSEHCCHKTFRGKIDIDGNTINDLLKNTIVKATKEIDKSWCLSVFADNAGVISFDDDWAVCFKVETHNHPSAVEPYGGAATGLGGVVRDVLGTGLGAKPVLNTDIFCFGPPDLAYRNLPPTVLHPRRVFKGVRAGVADYGNRLGIPTLNGAVRFDDRYTANPLVFCGTVGIMPKSMSQIGKQKPEDLIVLAGGKTGRDGIHGVTFASKQLSDESTTVSTSSVQVGNAITEKKLIDALMQARDKNLYCRITDCGGGGLSSAIGEMAATTGANVYLDKVPLKYSGLSYSEIWISESQERMLLAVPPNNIDELLNVFSSEGVEATVIGAFTNDFRLHLHYNGKEVGNLDLHFLHDGRPQVERSATWSCPSFPEPYFKESNNLNEELLYLLGTWNICSKEWVIRQYDHEVQGGSVLKPLVGCKNDGPGDAAIIRPILDSLKGIIVSNGINHNYGTIDPYHMAASAIDEALRQVISVGGNLKELALLDNFCWGDVNDPVILGALVKAAQACHDMSIEYGTPFISGKDSLYNEFTFEDKVISIPHTLLISAIAIMPDISKAISMDAKSPGNLIYIAGLTYDETGGSEYLLRHGVTGNKVPKVRPRIAKQLMEVISTATDQCLIASCHDCSEGGLGIAVAEMAFAGGLGADIQLDAVPLGEAIERNDFILFSESNSRFIIEVEPHNQKKFEALMKGQNTALIGKFNDTQILNILGINKKAVISIDIEQLKEAWQRPLKW